jgi:hypothetical protein
MLNEDEATAAEVRRVMELQVDAAMGKLRETINGDVARVKFIRETAIQLFSFYTDEDGEPPVTPGRAWMLAAMLWAAKPEDC